MDNYETYLANRVFVNNLLGLSWSIPCSDAFLECLVNNGIITSEERYKVFSYPLPTVFSSTSRYVRLIQIIRDNRTFLELLRFLVSQVSTELGETLRKIREDFQGYEFLRRFGSEF